MFWAPCVSFLLVFPMLLLYVLLLLVFPLFWAPYVSFSLVFPMLWVSCLQLLLVFQCSEIFRVSRLCDCIGEHGRGLAESTI